MDFDIFHPADLPRVDQSKLMNGTVVPRPIAWVSTVGAAGVNLAPFSYFNVVAVEPCIVMFSVGIPFGDRAGTVKDTLLNLREVPEFVLHLVDRELAEAMNDSSAEMPRGTNEFEASGLTPLPSTLVRPPRIAEAGVHMECRVHDTIELGRVPYHMVLGEVLVLHSRKGLINDRHHVDPGRHQPIARLGGPSLYTAPTDMFPIQNSHIKLP
jgi:flavin reductase (DIM6/NTAB) family NADH-FMN oxidoreductase RutF